MMLENVNYEREELMLLNMVRKGVLGELLHGEAAYIHDLRGQMFEVDHGTGSRRTPHYATDQGNLYPTHGLGPVARYMDVNRADAFDHLVAMSTPARRSRAVRRSQLPARPQSRMRSAPSGSAATFRRRSSNWRRAEPSWCSGTKRLLGRTAATTTSREPRARSAASRTASHSMPADELPAGVRSKMKPDEKRIEFPWMGHGHEAVVQRLRSRFPMWKKVGEVAAKHGGHGGMDFVMLVARAAVPHEGQGARPIGLRRRGVKTPWHPLSRASVERVPRQSFRLHPRSVALDASARDRSGIDRDLAPRQQGVRVFHDDAPKCRPSGSR
jgi:hypothetical protein